VQDGKTKEDEVWKDFLRGYQDARPFSETDFQTVPLFVGIRNVWLMGLNAGEARRRGGYGMMRDGYLDRHLAFLRKCKKDSLRGAASSEEGFKETGSISHLGTER
jgi:Ser/Thr protein kinase RdoA (MazF antagonist)